MIMIAPIKLIARIISDRLFVDILLSLLLVFIYTFLGKYALPDGVNAVFAERTSSLVLVPLMVLLIIFLIFLFPKLNKEKSLFKKIEGIEYKDAMLLLLPMTPIFQYILLNQDILNLSSSLAVFMFFFAIAFLLAFLVPWALSIISSKEVLMTVGLSMTFLLYNMSALSANFSWYLDGSLKIQQLYLVLTFLLLYTVIKIHKRFSYLLVIAFFLINTTVTFLNKEKVAGVFENSTIEKENEISAYLNPSQFANTPDIYLLVYEAYSNAETMLNYGFDNHQQIQFLKQKGFTIYDGAYSVGNHTLSSMSRVFEPGMSIRGNENSYYRNILSGNSSSLKALKQGGYKTFGVFYSDYWTQDNIPTYDNIYPAFQPPVVAGAGLLITAILMGEFRYNVSYSQIDYSLYVEKKREIMSSQNDCPIFLYSHNRYPGHSQSSGKCLPDETQNYIKGIEIANIEMQEDINSVALSNTSSVIIVAGDHGPYLTKNCSSLNNYDINEVDQLDVQDRYGTFLAIKWPDSDYSDRYDIQILQDIFPALFSYLSVNDSTFNQIRAERITVDEGRVSGVLVKDGYIVGGRDDGEPLFENRGIF